MNWFSTPLQGLHVLSNGRADYRLAPFDSSAEYLGFLDDGYPCCPVFPVLCCGRQSVFSSKEATLYWPSIYKENSMPVC